MAATVSSLGITFNTTAGVKTVVATPALGDVIVVIVAATGVASGLGISDNNTDGHGAAGFYNQIVSTLKNTSADQMVAFIRSQPIQSATSTTWTTSGDGASTGGGLQVFKVTGMTISGIAAVRQSGSQSNQAGSTTPAAALTGVALTANSLIGAVFNGSNVATMTPPTSWTESQDTGYNTPATGLETVFINTGFTGSTVTWGSATTVYSDLALELKADAGQTSLFPPRGGEALDATFGDTPKMVAIKRAAYYMQNWQKRRSGLFVPEPGILVPA